MATFCMTGLGGCSTMPPGVFTSPTDNVPLLDGPPIEDVVTPFDEALACLQGKIQPGITFAVGQIVDATGKESYAEGGTGKFVTQGAGEMVQSALFRAGVTVVNRRDPNIPVVETQWGIRNLEEQMPVNFYLSGSINSLDFIPGGGFSAQINGTGPRFRQNRIMIGLDLTMTDAMTGRIVASVPLQKQIFSREVGASMGRFFGETLVSLDAGGQQREAVHFALRQMLNFATFELLGQVMNAATFAPCKAQVSPFYGSIDSIGTGDPAALRLASGSGEALQNAAMQRSRQTEAAPAQQGNAARSIEEQVKELANHAMVFGARAVAAAEEAMAAETTDVAAQKTAEATELLRGAVQIMQRAAELGLDGPEGDAVALVVERGIGVVTAAQQALADRPEAGAAPAAEAGSDAAPEAEATSAQAAAPADTRESDPPEDDAAEEGAEPADAVPDAVAPTIGAPTAEALLLATEAAAEPVAPPAGMSGEEEASVSAEDTAPTGPASGPRIVPGTPEAQRFGLE
ncbi:CsgG/HfaB family protein [Histidinibacterium lentulum]|uniref:CsgG/HfaB family protein n=1 Tax=Histidinibacterium lentulum TaxID=2480588 RepID=UPI000F4C7515|nr:CsgG/HfaB family protein [Histidinibacterium lentulum]